VLEYRALNNLSNAFSYKHILFTNNLHSSPSSTRLELGFDLYNAKEKGDNPKVSCLTCSFSCIVMIVPVETV